MNKLSVSTLVLIVAFAAVLVQGKVIDDINVIGGQSNKPAESSSGGLTGLLVGDGLAGAVNVIGAQTDQQEDKDDKKSEEGSKPEPKPTPKPAEPKPAPKPAPKPSEAAKTVVDPLVAIVAKIIV